MVEKTFSYTRLLTKSFYHAQRSTPTTCPCNYKYHLWSWISSTICALKSYVKNLQDMLQSSSHPHGPFYIMLLPSRIIFHHCPITLTSLPFLTPCASTHVILAHNLLFFIISPHYDTICGMSSPIGLYLTNKKFLLNIPTHLNYHQTLLDHLKHHPHPLESCSLSLKPFSRAFLPS